MMQNETLPFLIQTKEGEFYKTKYSSRTPEGFHLGGGVHSHEYWHTEKGESLKLHRLANGRIWIDDTPPARGNRQHKKPTKQKARRDPR